MSLLTLSKKKMSMKTVFFAHRCTHLCSTLNRPEMFLTACVVTMPMCLSMLKMRLLEPSSYSLDRTSFSTPNTTPSLQRIPMAVLNITTWRHTCKFDHDMSGNYSELLAPLALWVRKSVGYQHCRKTNFSSYLPTTSHSAGSGFSLKT